MPIRTIRPEPEAEEQLRKLGIGFRRYDELMEYVEDVLAQHPEMFPRIPGTRISLCRTNEFVGGAFPDVPRLVLYFHYDAVEVRIIHVESNDAASYGLED